PVVPLLVGGDGTAQLRDPVARRVLVAAVLDGPDRCPLHGGRAVDVGKSLAQVDRAGAHRERRHLGEDRDGHAAVVGQEARRACGGLPAVGAVGGPGGGAHAPTIATTGDTGAGVPTRTTRPTCTFVDKPVDS